MNGRLFPVVALLTLLWSAPAHGAPSDDTAGQLVLLMTGTPQQQVEALSSFGTCGDPRLAGVLRAWAESPTPEVRQQAVKSLGQMKGVLAEQALFELARKRLKAGAALDEDSTVLLNAIAGLDTAGAARYLLGQTLTAGPLSALAQSLLEAHFPEFWAEARRILMPAPEPVPAPVPDSTPAPDFTSDSAAATAPAAATAAAATTTPAPDPATPSTASASHPDTVLLLQWLYSGATSELRLAAALALASSGDQRAIPVLEALLLEGTSQLRQVAMEALARWDVPAASVALSACAERSELSLRPRCIEALFKHTSTQATQLLIELEWQSGGYWTPLQSELLRERLFKQDPVRAQARYLSDGGDATQRTIEVLALLATTGSTARQSEGVRRSRQADSRVIPVLVAMALQHTDSSREVILRELAQRGEQQAWTALLEQVEDPAIPLAYKTDVVALLGAEKGENPARLLIPVGARTQDEGVRKAIRQTLKAHHPDMLPKKGEAATGELAFLAQEADSDRSGVVWMAGVGALHGAAAMGLMGADGATVLPALGGAVLGATLPLWLTMDDPRVVPQHAFWMLSTGAWSVSEATLILSAFGDGSDPSRLFLVGLGLLEAGGTVFGGLTRKSLGEDAAQTGFMHGSWAAGLSAGAGAALLSDSNEPDTQLLLGLIGAGGLGGLVASGVWGPDVSYNEQDALVFVEALSMGTYVGSQVALGLDLEDSQVAGLTLLGASTGYLTASIVGAYQDQRVEETGFQLFSSGAATLTADGLVGLAGGSKQAGAWARASGSLLGLTAAGLAGPKVRFSGGDAVATAALMAGGAWTGAWLDWMAQDDAVGEAAELGLGVGYLAGALIAASADLPVETALVASGAYSWGSVWGGGLGLVLTPWMDERLVPLAMLPSAWAASAVALGAYDSLGQPKGNVSAMVSLGAGWGLWQGVGLALGMNSDSAEVLSGAAMLGVSTGVLAGGLAGHYLAMDGDTAGRMASGGVLASYLGAGTALLVPEANQQGVLLTALSVGWAGLLLKGLYVPPAELTFGDYLAMGAGAGWGLFQSSMIADAVGLTDQRAAGARILGTGFGFLAGEVFARAADLTTGEVVFTELASYSGSGLLTGGYMLSDSSHDGWLAGLSAVGGVAGKLAVAPFADEVAFRADDVLEYLYLQGWGLWQGLGFAAWADASGTQTGGAALVGMSMGYLLPMVVNQFVDFSAMDDLLILGGSVWGTWIGGWGAYALGHRGSDIIPAAAILGDVGLVGSALLLIPAFGNSRETLGWMHVGGASGMGLGTVLMALITGNGETIAMGSSIGSVVGLAGGALLAASLTDSAPEQPSKPAAASSQGEDGSRSWTLAGIELPYMMPSTFLVPGPAGHQDDWVTLYGVEGTF